MGWGRTPEQIPEQQPSMSMRLAIVFAAMLICSKTTRLSQILGQKSMSLSLPAIAS
jgi:hypothetical protein